MINNNDSKLFSVTMTEKELRLFSEFLEQREFSMLSAAKTVKRKVVRVVKPTASQKAAAKRLDDMKVSRNLKDPLWHAERVREISSPYGINMPSNYMI